MWKRVLYQIQPLRDLCFIACTGRCINDRTREHATEVNAITAARHLPANCGVCQCAPEVYSLIIVANNPNKFARKVREALAIDANADSCVSAPSIALHHKEVMYPRRAVPMVDSWKSRNKTAKLQVPKVWSLVIELEKKEDVPQLSEM